MAKTLKYTESHEWIEVNDQVGTVGITDHAQRELGEIVYVELPKIGQEVNSGEEAAVLESTKAAADIYTPVSGTVVAVNEQLIDHAKLVNSSPEEAGWLFQLRLTNLSELEPLLETKLPKV